MVSTTEATIVGTFALFCPWNVHGRPARNRPSERPPSLESAGATAGGEVPAERRSRPTAAALPSPRPSMQPVVASRCGQRGPHRNLGRCPAGRRLRPLDR